MTRVVQLELTLSVEVEATFKKSKIDPNLSGWVITDIKSVRDASGKNPLEHEMFANFLLNERENELAELYAQQEP